MNSFLSKAKTEIDIKNQNRQKPRSTAKSKSTLKTKIDIKNRNRQQKPKLTKTKIDSKNTTVFATVTSGSEFTITFKDYMLLDSKLI